MRYKKRALSVKRLFPVARGCRSATWGKNRRNPPNTNSGKAHINNGLWLNAAVSSPCIKACIIRCPPQKGHCHPVHW